MAKNHYDKPMSDITSVKFSDGDWTRSEDASGNTEWLAVEGASVQFNHKGGQTQTHPTPPAVLKTGSSVKKKDGSYEVVEDLV